MCFMREISGKIKNKIPENPEKQKKFPKNFTLFFIF